MLLRVSVILLMFCRQKPKRTSVAVSWCRLGVGWGVVPATNHAHSDDGLSQVLRCHHSCATWHCVARPRRRNHVVSD